MNEEIEENVSLSSFAEVSPIVKLTNTILTHAYEQQADQIAIGELPPEADVAQVSETDPDDEKVFYKTGVQWEPVLSYPEDMRDAIMRRVLVMAAMDPFKPGQEDGTMLLRLATMKTAKFQVRMLGEGKGLLITRKEGRDLGDMDAFEIYEAAAEGNIERIEKLIGQGLDPNIECPQYPSTTLLHCAAMSGNRALVELLVDNGLDIRSVDGEGETILFTAVASGDRGFVEWLVGKGLGLEGNSAEGGALLHRAASQGHLELVQWLAEQGLDLKARDEYESTLLHSAAKSGNRELVRWLLHQDFDIESADELEDTPLRTAIAWENEAIARYLVEQGADVNARASYGKSMFHLAKDHCSSKMVDYLVAHGTRVPAIDKIKRLFMPRKSA